MDKIVSRMNARCRIIFCFLITIHAGKKKINTSSKKKKQLNEFGHIRNRL